MEVNLTHWIILITVITVTSIGCILIIRKNVLRYGIVFLISAALAIFLCFFFYINGYYRFVFPIRFILPTVALSFGFLSLFIIRFQPEKWTFPFFFITVNLVFTFEIILRLAFHFIVFRNAWDTWDSYSLYWVYLRLMHHIGRVFVSRKYRNPISYDTKKYWILFMLVIFYTIAGVAFLLIRHQRLTS
ncbi:hypothetical protein SM124_07295 [Bacillus sp. 31A1R]|uniref:Uncharacterized protein n=1 Tax=Robertmurraya mangrovi TaxID=3098077 RepID=A0ABU5IWP6_9BACI|nr:hypothetical protein [Bacillus sp. 31A1R]MDZ5471550.1 hypothetical protein [Bacillus sp. 31A1R]